MWKWKTAIPGSAIPFVRNAAIFHRSRYPSRFPPPGAGSFAVGNMSSVRYYGCGTSLLIGGTYGRIAADHAAAQLAK